MPRDFLDTVAEICDLGNQSTLAGVRAAKDDLRGRLARIDLSLPPAEYAGAVCQTVSDWLAR